MCIKIYLAFNGIFKYHLALNIDMIAFHWNGKRLYVNYQFSTHTLNYASD